MHVVIAGAGKLGFHLAKILKEKRYKVTLVEKSSDVSNELSNELDCEFVIGDATKPSVLQDASVREADIVLALTGNDETNLVVCLMSKNFGARQVAARLSGTHYDENTLKKLGIDLVVYPEAAAAGYISELIAKPEILDLAFIAHGQAEIVEMEVPEKSKLAGKTVAKASTKEAKVIALIRNNVLTLPSENTVLKPGDRILVVSRTGKASDARKLL